MDSNEIVDEIVVDFDNDEDDDEDEQEEATETDTSEVEQQDEGSDQSSNSNSNSSSNSSDSDNFLVEDVDAYVESNVTFDRRSTAEHSYLGSVERTRRRQFIEPRSVVTIPITLIRNVVVFPGDTLPLVLDQQNVLSRLLASTEQSNDSVAFGALTLDCTRRIVSSVGVVAEIRSVRSHKNYTYNDTILDNRGNSILSKARYRFRVLHFLDMKQSVTTCSTATTSGGGTGTIAPTPTESKATMIALPEQQTLAFLRTLIDVQNLYARVEILEDADISKCPPSSAIKYYGKPTSSTIIPNRVVSLSHLEYWVYELYNIDLLAEKARSLTQLILPPTPTSTSSTTSRITSTNNNSNNNNNNNNSDVDLLKALGPSQLSFWIAANLPISLNDRVQLLEAPTTLMRLKLEIDILLGMDLLCCGHCRAPLTRRSHMISMTSDGWRSAFVNPQGYVHEALTVSRMNGLRLIGRPSTQSSWFPGYAWTITECARCSSHIGWKFTATTADLKPEYFYGVSMANVSTSRKST